MGFFRWFVEEKPLTAVVDDQRILVWDEIRARDLRIGRLRLFDVDSERDLTTG
jgi:hypothetical protein